MVRLPYSKRIAVAALAAAGALFALAVAGPWGGARLAVGQQPSVVTAELAQAFSRAGPAERLPVLIEVRREDAPVPLSLDPDQRAAEHASNLAFLYRSSVERLRRAVPAELSFDIEAGEVLWVGGAVTAELRRDQVEALETAPDVRRIYYDGLVEVELAGSHDAVALVWAPGFPAAQDPAGGLPWGLEAIGAPDLWAAGATGEGTVVAIIDSGVDGDHPLLWRKWRGLSTSPELAWFDPWGLTDVPEDDDNTGGVGHGTTVMATAVGSLEPGDTLIVFGQPEVVQSELEVVTGVAPGAEWVAANGFQGFGTGQYTRLSILLQAMQWVLDPDGDPATVSDVPDVLNNSWGFGAGGCNGFFDRAIDALEAAGVPVVFAAGNRSSGFDTVTAPASRADLLLNAFAVGAAELSDGDIVVSPNSLGGPSPCAPGAVKPEVVASGEVPLVRGLTRHTAEVRGRSGAFTSWAAPYASGSLALLAGLNPGASATALKDALFSTADDLPPPGPDNRSGAGFIDLAAAAERIGGLGGVQVAISGWSWDSAGAKLEIQLRNAGRQLFPGGDAELRRRGTPLARATAPMIGPQARSRVVFDDLPADLDAEAGLSLRLTSYGAILEFPVALAPVTASAVQLMDGSVVLTLDGNGRLGGVAGSPGFEFMGSDWLTAGSFLFARGDQVSDAAYVDVLQQPGLKPNPVGSDTDWRALDATEEGDRASLEFADDRALRPLGATVGQEVEVVSMGDSAAFVVLSAVVDFGEGNGIPQAGLLLDWDFAGRDSVGWDSVLGASVMTAPDSAGPWMALTTAPVAPATHSAIALGDPANGFYIPSSGELAKLDGFTDAAKGRFLRLGGPQASDASVADWAQSVGVGSLSTGERSVFLIAAGSSKPALQAALDSARAFASQRFPQPPPAVVSSDLRLLPAYPSPFDPLEGEVLKLPFLIDRGLDPVSARLEVYTISGSLIYSEQRQLEPDQPVEPFRWSGRLGNGEPAASGVYGYVIRVGDQLKWGKFVLLK